MIPYCLRCKWHLSKVEALKWDGTGDTDVCGKSFQTYRDEVGTLKFKTRGEIQRCEECGNITFDGRHVIYYRCAEQNKNMKCADFRPIILWVIPWLWDRIRGKLK